MTLKNTSKVWKKIILPEASSILDAAKNLEENGVQIVLVVDKKKCLVGTVSDGDIRRGLLAGLDLNSSVLKVVNKKPRVVPEAVTSDLALEIMKSNNLRQIPIVDKSNKIKGIHLWDEIAVKESRSNIMVIMAGGKGVRMRPYTESCPKPMLEVANKPILQHIIEKAKNEGFNKFIISVNYLGQMIKDFFGSGEKFGIDIEYLDEDSPLGTAGSLSLLKIKTKEPFLVVNGDVVTGVRFKKILKFHDTQNAHATMAVSLHEWQHPFGVVHMNGMNITKIEEMPVSRDYINAGVYVLSPEVLKLLKKNKFCDMPELFERLKANNFSTIAYPVHEQWLDVGKPDDYYLAENYLKK